MPVEKQSDTHMAKTIAMEPAIQAKKRVEPGFLKTHPAKPQQCEPPIQSKRRTPGPPTTLTNGFYENGLNQDEYALLGNQDKFAENVKYKVKPSVPTRDISPPKQMKLQKKEKENKLPNPGPVVDTSQFSKPVTPLAPRKPKNQSKQPVKEQKDKNEQQVQETGVRSLQQSKSEPKRSERKTVETKNLNMGDPVKDSMKTKKIGNMNEFVQTNMEKGIADSAAEAPADYALKYKTGVAPPRPTKKVSEYQKQFAWKTGLPASPLLKAEQVVYNSVPTLSPPKKDVIPKVSEYQKQFKQFPLVPVPKEDKSEPVQSKRNQLPRSKSMEGLSPAEIPTAGSKPVIAPNNKRLTLETDQKAVEPAPIVPRKKQRQFQSEYKSNYKSPTRFDYVRGSWHGADPPQVKIKADDTAADSYLANWFAEVIELRRKASEYRKRAEGTHFSREHLVQLMAKQTDLWDASTLSARSNLSALSLESGLAAHKNRQEKQEKQYRGGYSTAATIASEDEQKVESVMDEDDIPPVKKQAWADQDEIDETPRDSEATFTPTEGRLTTPKLRDQIKKDGKQKRRHHLDRTTPCVGGSLLSSPPQQKKNSLGQKTTEFSDNGSLASMEEEEEFIDKPAYKPLAGQKTYTIDQGRITPAPTYGLMTRDTHALRDDEASVDKPMPTQYVHTPVRGKRDRPGGLDTIGEGFGETYNKSKVGGKHDISWTIDGGLPVPRIDADDDDVLSVSMQSIASSCSVASATLERARKRKEEFWGKNGIASR